MNRLLANKILEEILDPSLIDFDACHISPKFESELQKREYEQMLCDVHHCNDRRALIHTRRGAQIVLLYMKVWHIGVRQAVRELITDEAYTLFVCPQRDALECQTNKVSEHHLRASRGWLLCLLQKRFLPTSWIPQQWSEPLKTLLVSYRLKWSCVQTGETHVK